MFLPILRKQQYHHSGWRGCVSASSAAGYRTRELVGLTFYFEVDALDVMTSQEMA